MKNSRCNDYSRTISERRLEDLKEDAQNLESRSTLSTNLYVPFNPNSVNKPQRLK